MDYIVLKTTSEIEKLKVSNKIVAEVLLALKNIIKPGVSTLYLNNFAEEMAKRKGAIPGFKNFKGFPYSLCTSVNDITIHGFPSDYQLVEGDIISIDFGTVVDGFYGDAAITVPVGKVSARAKKLIRVAREALYKGINKAIPGGKLSDITKAIQSHVEKNNLYVIRTYGGHGVGKELHERPHVSNHMDYSENVLLKPGMVLAIEPIVSEGGYEVKLQNNRQVVVTKEGKLSAHFEHTIAITNGRPIILSK
jgi:methionyl aminopeptidase